MEARVPNCLTQLIHKIEMVDQRHQQNDPQYIKWIEQITSPSFTLISTLFLSFQNDFTEQSTRNQILSILSSFLKEKPNSVIPQLSLSSLFHSSLTKYIDHSIQGKALNLSLMNAYHILIQIYSTEHSHKLNNEVILTRLFTGLTVVNEQKTLEDILKVIMNINAVTYEEKGSSVIKAYKACKDADLFNELLLKAYHKQPKGKKKMIILLMINTLITKLNSLVFSRSDFESLVDILLLNLEDEATDEHRYLMLDTIQKITLVSAYYQLQYRIEDIIELMDDIKANDSQPPQITAVCKAIMINITHHLMNSSEC